MDGDGNTADAGTLKAKLQEKEDELAKIKLELEKANGRVAGAEKKFSEWASEVGEIRKERETLQKALSDAQVAITEMKKVSEGKSVPPGKTGDGTGGGGGEEKPEDIESALTESQRKAGEVAFAALSDAEKVKYAGDPAFRVAFLKRLVQAAPVVPASPWTTTGEPKQKAKGRDGVDAILDRVFAKKKQTSFVPDGPRSSFSGSADESGGEKIVEDTRVH